MQLSARRRSENFERRAKVIGNLSVCQLLFEMKNTMSSAYFD